MVLNVKAAGTGPLHFQWNFNGSPLAGETNSQLTLSRITTNQTGYYYAEVTDTTYGTQVSSNALVTVLESLSPSFITQPISQAVPIGANVIISASISGTPPLLFRWRKNGANLTGDSRITEVATPSLSILNAQLSDVGNFSLVVTNPAGAITSQVAGLSVLASTPVTLQPWSPTNLFTNIGEDISIAATVSGTGPFSYQWSKNAIIVEGATNSILVLANLQPEDSGLYSVIATSLAQYGSRYVRLLVGARPEIEQEYTFIAVTGSAESIAGTNDGLGDMARFFGPRGVTVDGAGNVFVADSGNHTIRKISPDGLVTTVAGLPKSVGSSDGVGSVARFQVPYGMAVDNEGNVFVADSGNNTIRKIGPGGVVITVAGYPGAAGSGDGIGIRARFNNPGGVAVDEAGNVYVADNGNHTIRKIDPSGSVKTVGGLPGNVGNEDGTSNAARLNFPYGVAVDGEGNIYVADTGNNRICMTAKTCADRPMIDSTSGPVGVLRQLDFSPQTAINWQWRFLQRPSGSMAELSSATVRNPTFIPDIVGPYLFQLRATNALGEICIRNQEFAAWIPLEGASQALNTTNMFWTTGGDMPWFVQTNVTKDGVSAAQTGPITNSQQSWLQADFSPPTPGILSFQWRVSSEECYDLLAFFLNVIEVDYLCRDVAWQQTQIELISTNAQTLRWTYIKDSAGADAGWLDQVSFTPVPLSAPSIVTEPASVIALDGTNVTLSATVSGFPSPSFQWRKDGTNLVSTSRITGTWTTNLSITSVQPTDAGNYTLVVTNSIGAITSQVAVLTVNLAPPTILGAVSVTKPMVFLGDRTSFQVTAQGSKPLAYQWYKEGSPLRDGTNISGVRQPALTITNVQLNDIGAYWVVVTNVVGSCTSQVATLNLTPLVPTKLAGNWTNAGPGKAVAIQGDFAYLACGGNSVPGGRGLGVFDIRDPNKPVELGWWVATADATGVAVSSNYAYVTVQDSLRVVDVNNATNPVQVATCTFSGSALGMSIANGFAYVVSGEAGLHVIDIHNPSNPQWLATFDTIGTAKAVAVAGLYAYVADGSYGLRVIDVSNPTAPQGVGFWVTSGNAQGIAVSGNFAYVAVGTAGLEVIDISNPTKPPRVGGCSGFTAMGVVVVEPYAYVACGPAGLAVVDIRDPVNPQKVGGRECGSASGIAVVGNYAYVADGYGGLAIVQISGFAPVITQQPTNLTLIAGDQTFFSVSVSGSPPLFYQWQHLDTILPGKTNVTLVLGGTGQNLAGFYAVTITNAFGQITSSNAWLTILEPGPQALSYREQFSFTYAGPAGRTCEIWASTNLMDWIMLDVFTNNTGMLPFTDPAIHLPRRFYQVREQP